MISEQLRELIKVKYDELKSYRKVADLFAVSHVSVKNIVTNNYVRKPAKRVPKFNKGKGEEARLKRAASQLGVNGPSDRPESSKPL